LAGLVKNADLEARSYLLTGEAYFLEPHQRAVHRVEDRLTVLRRLMQADDPAQRARLPELERLIEEKLSEIGELIALQEEAGRQAATARAVSGDARLSMDKIRRVLNDLTQAERRLLTERQIEASRDTHVTLTTFALVNLSALAMLVLAYVFAVAYVQRRRRTQAQLERAYAELEARVQERTEELAQANRTLHREIEDRRRAQEDLGREQGILKLILDSLGDGVVVADAQGRMILFNPAGERILGIGPTGEDQDRWSQVYGIYEHDRKTLVEPEHLPLVRAFRGESIDEQELFVRNPRLPNGIDISVTGRPMIGADGEILGGVIIFRDITLRKNLENDREGMVRKMMEALAEVKTLSGLLPICARCKSIRDDKGYWRRLEAYLGEHSEAEFSHGLCPKCASDLYPETFPAKGTKPGQPG
ncbi:MAG TPA: CHASE3 domain-containing protein, partial [Kiritimatiellia bacterium]